jgi:hypothetical protein
VFYRDCRATGVGGARLCVAVTIEPFEVSRWGGGCGGLLWDFNQAGSVAASRCGLFGQAPWRFDGPEVGIAELGVRGAGMTAGRSWWWSKPDLTAALRICLDGIVLQLLSTTIYIDLEYCYLIISRPTGAGNGARRVSEFFPHLTTARNLTFSSRPISPVAMG